MIRSLLHACWFLTGFFFVFGLGSAFADTVPATTSDVTVSIRWMMNQQTYRYAGSQDAACNAWDYENTNTVYDYRAATYSSGTTYGCEVWQTSKSTGATAKSSTLSAYYQTSCDGFATVRVNSASVSGYAAAASYVCSAGVQSCPANSTGPVGGLCTCSAGYIAEGGQCVVPACPSAGTSAHTGGAVAWAVTGSSSACTSGFGFGGCGVTCTSGVSAGGNAACTGCTFTGAAAPEGAPDGSPKPAETTEADCAAKGQGYATINGVTTCAPADSKTDTTTTTSSTMPPGGAPTTTNSTTAKTTTCEGGNCSTTTTTTSGDGTATTETTGTTLSGFCEQNPDSSICKAVDNPCLKENDSVACAEFGTVEDPGDLPTQAAPIATSLTPVYVAQNMTCPADVPLPKGMTFSWAGACEFASGVYWAVIAVAWLTAGLILFGAVKES